MLTGGIMHALVTHDKEFVLVGSVRDDGPLPDVYTDVIEGQRAMRAELADVGFCLMVATMLHSVATGNILPASIPLVCVDINPATVTKLADRGSSQARGIVTDVGLFLEQLAARAGARLPRADLATTRGQRRARSAAPTTPASGPERARARSGGTDAVPDADQRPRERRCGPGRAAGRRPRRRRRRRPRSSGSKAATRLATPDAEPVADRGERRAARRGRRASAAAVTIGPVEPLRVAAAELLEHGRLAADPVAGEADQRVAAAVLLPAAAAAALAGPAVGHDLHVAELAGHPVAPAVHRAVEDHRAADAGAQRDARRASATPRAAP